MKLVTLEDGKYAIQFCFDSMVQIEVRIFINAIEEVDEQRYPNIKVSPYNAEFPLSFLPLKSNEGKDHLFSDENAVFDETLYKKNEIFQGNLTKIIIL